MEEITDIEQKKIILMGLDNSGKTSIVLALKGNRNLLSYFSLTPTLGVNVNKILDGVGGYVFWDFGGQEQFRAKYLADFVRYAESTERFIFVIDVQDIPRIPEALSYLQQILQEMGNINLQIPLDIFFHKYDPSIEIMGNTEVEEAVQNATQELKAIIPPETHYRIFKTTIYTVFGQTL